jgi:hypothetical protein
MKDPLEESLTEEYVKSPGFEAVNDGFSINLF